MSHLTPAAGVAWRLAAGEAGAAGHGLIAPVHLVMGILSLDKVGRDGAETLGLSGVEFESVRRERATLAELLGGLGAEAADLRRTLREAAGTGPGTPPGPVSRSAETKAAFARAAVLSEPEAPSILHLLLALTEHEDAVIAKALAERGIRLTEIAARTRAFVDEAKPGPGEAMAAAALGDTGTPTLDRFLRGRLVGQDAVIERVVRRLRLAHAGLSERRGPLGVFLFLGPAGVGKTELARLLAEHLFGGAADLTRFDMSEYMEEQAVARLLGAPPGYVGYDQEGQLTSALRSRPYSVVLLDEAEKAHPRIFDIFLQVFDDGRVTDAHGRTADARHAIFILTSNLGTAEARDPLGFEGAGDGNSAHDLPSGALAEARRFFRAEFLSRMDEVLVFRPLAARDLSRILDLLLARVTDLARDRHGVALSYEPEARAFLLRCGTNIEHGARALHRAVESLVEAPFSSLLLTGKLEAHRAWRLVYDEGGVYWLPASPD